MREYHRITSRWCVLPQLLFTFTSLSHKIYNKNKLLYNITSRNPINLFTINKRNSLKYYYLNKKVSMLLTDTEINEAKL